MNLIEEKIQIIAKEMQEANASPWTITKILKEINLLNTKSSKKLREKALELLKELDPEAGQTYEAFSRMTVYTSKENIESFNRGHIIKSLTKETSIARSVAEKITIEIENQIKDSKIDFLTPALIRELVNAKLVTYGFEEFRNNYTRVGEPVYEVKKKFLIEPYANLSTKEYNFLSVIPKQIRKEHFGGNIFIEDVEGFSSRPYSYSFIAETKDTLEKTIINSIKQIIQNKKYFCLQPNIFGLTFACAPFLKNKAQTKKAAALILELIQIPEKEFSISLELFTPTAFEKSGEHKLKATALSNFLAEESKSVVCVDSKYSMKLIETKNKSFRILNCSNSEYFPLNNELFSPTQGIDLFVNINLEKIAQCKEEGKFFEKLEKLSTEIKKLSELKKELLLEKEYLKELKLGEMKTAIGLTSLTELAKNFENTKPREFANKTYRELNRLFKDELLFGLGSKEAQKKFDNTSGKKVYPQGSMNFEECLDSKKCCFTGYATTTKEVNELIDKKVKQIIFVGKE